MTPADFLREVVEPNVQDATQTADARSIVNAILSLEALAGVIHAHGKAANLPDLARHARDGDFKEALAKCDLSFRIARDLAASIKHGELSDPRKCLLPRLVTVPGAVHVSGGGMMGFGPISSGPISSIPTVYIALADGRPNRHRLS